MLFCQCKKDEAPLRVRYHNSTGQSLNNVSAVLLRDGSSVNIGDLAPDAYSDYVEVEKIVLIYRTAPYHYLEGKTISKPFVSGPFFDCLTGANEIFYTSGDFTFQAKKFEDEWVDDEDKVHFDLQLEQ